MPSYSATGINIRLGTTQLAGTITHNSDLQRKKREAAQNSIAVEKRLRHSEMLPEEPVPFPGDTQGFRLNFLQNVPFLQVEARAPLGGLPDRYAAVARALVLHVTLSEKTFLPSFETGKPQHLLIDVFFNGQLASSVLMHLRDIHTGAKGLEQLFTGTRDGYLTERPWVLEASEQGMSGDLSTLKTSTTAHERWEQISKLLLKEVNERGLNKWGEGPPSGRYLESLATMDMPDSVRDMQRPGRKSFGVIDVVVTAGIGKKGTAEYLKAPARLVDDRFRKRKDSGIGTMLSIKTSAGFDVAQVENDGIVDTRESGAFFALPLPDSNTGQWSSPHPLSHAAGSSTTSPDLNSPAFVNPRDLVITPPTSHLSNSRGHALEDSQVKHSEVASFRIPDLPFRSIPQPDASQDHTTLDNLSDAFDGPNQNILNSGRPRPLKFPLIGPLPALRGPPPQVGFFSVSPHQGPVDRGLIDPELPPSSILISRLVITGRNDICLVDHVWPVSQRVAINRRLKKRRRSSHEPSRKRKHSPGSAEYSESAVSSRHRNKGVVIVRLTTPPPTSPAKIVDPDATLSIDKTKSGTIYDAKSIRSRNSPTFDLKVADIAPTPNDETQQLSLGNVDFDRADPNSIAYPLISEAEDPPRRISHRVSARNDLSTQGSKAKPFIFENPEELLKCQARKRRGSAQAKFGIVAPVEVDNAAPGAKMFVQTPHVAAFLRDASSSLSSVPSSPEPTPPCNVFPLPSLTPPISYATSNAAVTHNQSSLRPSRIPATSTPLSHLPSPRTALANTSNYSGKGYERRHPSTLRPKVPLKQSCVINHGEDRSHGEQLRRQIKSEKRGNFTEDMVVVGCRFFVTDR